MPRSIPERPDPEQLRRQAKELRRAVAAGDPEARERARRHHPRWRTASPDEPAFALADAQRVIARELGFASWARLRSWLAERAAGTVRAADRDYYWYADRAGRVQRQLSAGGDEARALARRWHPALAEASDAELAARSFDLDDGRRIVAAEHGFERWADFVDHLAATGHGPHEHDDALDDAPDTARGERFAEAVEALRQGRRDALAALLDRDPGLARQRGGEGRTLLLLAAQERDAEAVALLLAAGADPGEPQDDGWTPLHQAAYGEPPATEPGGQDPSLAVMELLLAAGADLGAEARGSGGTPLLQALFWGLRPLAERLAREAVVPVNLRTAAGLGRLDLLESLVDAQGRLRPAARAQRGYAAPHDGFPPPVPSDDDADVWADALVYAAVNGRREAVEWLLERGADPSRAPYMENALFGAVRNGSVELVRHLLARGADLDARAHFGAMRDLTALHHAVSVVRPEMVEVLVDAGADLAATDGTQGATPLEWARFFEAEDIARRLDAAAREHEEGAPR